MFGPDTIEHRASSSCFVRRQSKRQDLEERFQRETDTEDVWGIISD